jgi:hypothetical protein
MLARLSMALARARAVLLAPPVSSSNAGGCSCSFRQPSTSGCSISSGASWRSTSRGGFRSYTAQLRRSASSRGYCSAVSPIVSSSPPRRRGCGGGAGRRLGITTPPVFVRESGPPPQQGPANHVVVFVHGSSPIERPGFAWTNGQSRPPLVRRPSRRLERARAVLACRAGLSGSTTESRRERTGRARPSARARASEALIGWANAEAGAIISSRPPPR